MIAAPMPCGYGVSPSARIDGRVRYPLCVNDYRKKLSTHKSFTGSGLEREISHLHKAEVWALAGRAKRGALPKAEIIDGNSRRTWEEDQWPEPASIGEDYSCEPIAHAKWRVT